MPTITLRSALLNGVVSPALIGLWKSGSDQHRDLTGGGVVTTLYSVTFLVFTLGFLYIPWSNHIVEVATFIAMAFFCFLGSLFFLYQRCKPVLCFIRGCEKLEKSMRMSIGELSPYDLKELANSALLSKIAYVLHLEKEDCRGQAYDEARVIVKTHFDIMGLFNLRKYQDIRQYYTESKKEKSGIMLPS